MKVTARAPGLPGDQPKTANHQKSQSTPMCGERGDVTMTIPELITRLRGDMSSKLEQRNKSAAELAELRDADTQDEAKIAEVRKGIDGLDAELDALTARVTELRSEQERDEAAQRLTEQVREGAPAPKYDGVARVGREERTYSAHKSARGEASYFADAFSAERGNTHARTRLERHAVEVEREGEMTERATTTGSFAGLVVPQYLVDQAALVARAGRPFANCVTSLPLPAQGMSLIIPRGTTGASEAVQATENSSVSSTDEVWANVTVPVVTIAGQQDVSRQSLERGAPGIDELIYMDLAGAYAVALDQQVLSGTGAGGQMLGVLNTGSINQATAFAAAATVATYYTKVAGQINAVETTRFLAPNLIAMHPRRWNWLVSQLDSSNRPLAVPNLNGPFNAVAFSNAPIDTPSVTAVGNQQGLPIITDANIPTSVGSGPEDQVIVCRKEDLILWENGDGLPRELRFEQTLGNQLTVKLVAYNYAAFTAGRYPTAVGVVGGNSGAGFGLVAPTF